MSKTNIGSAPRSLRTIAEENAPARNLLPDPKMPEREPEYTDAALAALPDGKDTRTGDPSPFKNLKGGR